MVSQHATTAQDILCAIQSTEIESYFLCMDECYPGLYIGDISAAKNKDSLKNVGITHVLNTAQGKKFTMVDTEADYYKDVGIQYLGLKLLDIATANIAQYFEDGARFIEDALSAGGKVLVHCFMGISRSATISCAFLMLHRNMNAIEAITSLRKNRAIYPNDGFLSQLADLDNKLRASKGNSSIVNN
ncbi:hypothetical protein Pmani_011841 [Petrolisthes manimaculis]|uniref:Dual specificity protein phosphatase n=1 Tax=Petrolisthes manimaculis TaxID=1843537 RepID=A0AAE1UFQ1_9EUCA|nr:hypothetical protein Pmani_011841 [Petrolisthes manimaculis]